MFLHEARDRGLDAAIVSPAKILPQHRIDPEQHEVALDVIYDRRRDGYDPLQTDPLGVTVAPDGRTVLLAGQDGTDLQLTLWDVAERASAPMLVDAPRYQAMDADPDHTLLAASDKGGVRLWDLDPERAAARICSTLDRDLTRAEWDELVPGRPYRATCG